jgi:hypothetical protein
VAEAQARLQRTFDGLREDVDAASAALDEKADAVEERFAELESRVDIAAKREAAEMTSDATSFADAVEAELHDWDAAIERMQARAAVKAYSAASGPRPRSPTSGRRGFGPLIASPSPARPRARRGKSRRSASPPHSTTSNRRPARPPQSSSEEGDND